MLSKSTAETMDGSAFGLLEYVDTLNLGDEIQSLAASQFLPKVDVALNRENLAEPCGGKVSVIMNGWYMHRPENWPPPVNIDPLLISMHITQEISPQNLNRIQPNIRMLCPEGVEYFRHFGPIGARDLNTLRMLHESGVDSYFSGCMTLTFPQYQGLRNDKVYCVDVDDEIFFWLKESAEFNLHRLSHWEFDNDRLLRFSRAEDLLDKYKRAKLVLTSRLHCALPCLAFGTPVIFVEIAPDGYRFEGLRDHLHCVPRERLVSGFDAWWSSDFQANKSSFLPLRNKLRVNTNHFVETRLNKA